MHKSFIYKLTILLSLLLLAVVPINAENYYTIDDYNVEIDVLENGDLNIHETIHANFNSPRHGIYLKIANYYRKDIDGETYDFKFPVTNIKVNSGQKFKVSHDLQDTTIKIGSRNSFVEGKNVYDVSYTVETEKLNFPEFSLFYYNIINLWDTTINHVSFKISFPKSFDDETLRFYVDNFAYDHKVDYEIIDNTITGECIEGLSFYEPLTISLELPQNYFNYPFYDVIIKDFLNIDMDLFLFIISLTLIALYLSKKYGNRHLIKETLDFNLVNEIDSVTCNNLFFGHFKSEFICSLIIEWANDGYIAIEEKENKLYFKRLNELPFEAPDYQRKLFSWIFQESNLTSVNELKNSQSVITDIILTFSNSEKNQSLIMQNKVL